MDDVPSETCFVFIKNVGKMNFKSIVWLIKATFYFLLLRSLNNDNNKNSNSDDNIWRLDQEHHFSSTTLCSRAQ